MNLRQAKTILIIFTYIFVMFLLPYVTMYNLSAIFNISNLNSLQVYTNFISYLVLILITIALFGKELMSDLKQLNNPFSFIKGVAIGWLLLWVCSIVSSFVLITITQSEESSQNQQFIELLMQVHPIFMTVTTVIFAPIVEEVVFRLTIMKNLVHQPWIGIVISSFIFGMIHVISAGDFIYSLPYIAMGFALGYTYHKHQNIWYSIGVHIFQNFFSTVILLLSMSA